MEHCTGGSKEIKFNITYRDKLFRENITRTVLQKEDSHSDDKTEKQQTPTAAWKMGCRGHYRNQVFSEGCSRRQQEQRTTGISGLQ